LIRLSAGHPDWVLGYQDETWWSRLALPSLHSWADEETPLRLVSQSKDKHDPDPLALACYGLMRADTNRMMLRFVDGRPVSDVTISFLEWVCEQLKAEGKTALLLVWDNAPWHKSHKVSEWIAQHNAGAKGEGGVRLLSCLLPIKSPWLNPIEPCWVHGKRAIVEPERKLSAAETEQRVCDYFGCEHLDHIAIAKKVA